jgi:hypothetical protein
MYAYVGNNPVNYTDPWGLESTSDKDKKSHKKFIWICPGKPPDQKNRRLWGRGCSDAAIGACSFSPDPIVCNLIRKEVTRDICTYGKNIDFKIEFDLKNNKYSR